MKKRCFTKPEIQFSYHFSLISGFPSCLRLYFVNDLFCDFQFYHKFVCTKITHIHLLIVMLCFSDHQIPNRLRMLLISVGPMHSLISFVLLCDFLLNNNNKINFSHFATLLVTHKNWVKFDSVFIMLYSLFYVLFHSIIHHPESVGVCICLF